MSCKAKWRNGSCTVYAAPVFLGLIPLSRGAISVFWLSPKFPVVYTSFAKPRGSLRWITLEMPVWQGCKYTTAVWPRWHHNSGDRKQNAPASACLRFSPSLCSSLCKHLLIDENQSQLVALLTRASHSSVVLMSSLLAGETQAGAITAQDEAYLPRK